MGLLPENKRRNVDSIKKKAFWIYGAPYSGKTFFANTFPDVLMLNTDGNIKFVDAPYVEIKDTKEGRVDKTGWENFVATVDELAMENHSFKTLVVDLTEGVYNFARRFVLSREGYTHESDGGYGKGYALVDDEFFPTLGKLVGLNYETLVLISHEKWTEVTTKRGDKISKVAPNIREGVANKIAGMVDFTGRLVCEDDVRTINIKPSEYQFGGGRPEFVGKSIPATYEAICGLYNINPMEQAAEVKQEPVSTDNNAQNVDTVETVEETPKRKLKRKVDGE